MRPAHQPRRALAWRAALLFATVGLFTTGCATDPRAAVWDDLVNQRAPGTQAIQLASASTTGREFRDPGFGITLTYPAGWTVQSAQRWGKEENTIRFRPDRLSHLGPSVYYARYESYAVPRTPGNEEAMFRESAVRKEKQRLESGLRNYANVPESFVFKRVGERPAMSYLAVYTDRGKAMAEYFIRVAGEKTAAMFFMKGTLAEIEALHSSIDAMMETVQVL